MRPLILIDGSNFTFWRYNATKAWWSHSKQGPVEECRIDHPLFCEKYTKHFQDTVAKIHKKFKTTDLIWCQDTPRKKLWRMDIDLEYKGTRDDQRCPEIGPVFEYTYGTLLSKNNSLTISSESAEADDCVGTICHYIRDTQPTRKVIIISNDTDFLQLVDEHIKLFKPSKLTEVPLKCESGQKYLQLKVILGDKSDNIPKIFAGCGPKKAEELVTDPDAFDRHIRNHPERWQRYQHNLNLICFHQIPTEIKEDIIRKYKTLYDQKASSTKIQLKKTPIRQPKIRLKKTPRKPTLSLSLKT